MFERSPAKIWRNKDVLYRLKYSYCRDCKRSFYPPRGRCIYCGSSNIEYKYSSGRGIVREFTIVYQAPSGHTDMSPIIIGLIEMEEGFRLMAQIVDVKPEEITSDMKVEAVLRKMIVDGDTGLIYYGLKFAPSLERS